MYFPIFLQDLKPHVQEQLIEIIGAKHDSSMPIVILENDCICHDCKYQSVCGTYDNVADCDFFEIAS